MATHDGGVHRRSPTAARRRDGLLAGAAGVVSGVVGLGVADLASWLVTPLGSPVPAVGSLIITLLPAPLVNFGKDSLGTADKPILIALVTVFVLAVAGLGGRVERHRRYGGAAVYALLAVLGLVGVAAGAGAQLAAYVPTVVGLVVGYLVLSSLITRLRRWHPGRAAPSEDGAANPARRGFLIATAVVGVLGTTAAVTGRMLVNGAGRVNDLRSKLALPAPARPAAPVPAGADLGVSGLSPYVTPNADFYRIDTALQVPVVDPTGWELRITGMVEQEVTIGYAELVALPLTEHLVTLTCVSNEVGGDLIGNARWLGYPIRELLARARPQAGADMVLSTSTDGFSAGTPLSALTDPDRLALLAVGMNGEPLPLEHGFPVRMVVPGLYGYVSATKWVVELKVTTFAQDQGYWTPLGWSADGPIKLSSRIDVPNRSADAGTVMVAGVAWAQHTGVGTVEVRVDTGPWVSAELAETAGPDTWRQWRYAWPATSGNHTLTVRATDANGRRQTQASAPPAPDGATGYHSVSVKIR